MADIKELRAKLEAATPGERRVIPLPDGRIAISHPKRDYISDLREVSDPGLRAEAEAYVAFINAAPALLAVVEAALERDGCSEVCSAMKPYRGCTCGAEALDRALASLTRNDEVERG